MYVGNARVDDEGDQQEPETRTWKRAVVALVTVSKIVAGLFGFVPVEAMTKFAVRSGRSQQL